MAARGNRDELVIATKVGKLGGCEDWRTRRSAPRCEESLERLGTDRIDLYYAHEDDLETPLDETIGAFDAVVRAGKVRYVAASNYTAERLAEALRVATATASPGTSRSSPSTTS